MEGERPKIIEPTEPISSPEGVDKWRFKAAQPAEPTTEGLVAQFLAEKPDEAVLMLSLHCPDRTRRYISLHIKPEDLLLAPDYFLRRFMEPSVYSLLHWHRTKGTEGAKA